MHAPRLTDDAAYLLAREHAFHLAPSGCICPPTTTDLEVRGTCPWCVAYWTVRTRMEAQEAAARAQALREYTRALREYAGKQRARAGAIRERLEKHHAKGTK